VRRHVTTLPVSRCKLFPVCMPSLYAKGQIPLRYLVADSVMEFGFKVSRTRVSDSPRCAIDKLRRIEKLQLSAISRRYECSTLAEMGDRLATMDMGRKLGVCASLGSLIPT